MADYTGTIVNLSEINLARAASYGGGEIALEDILTSRESNYQAVEVNASAASSVKAPYGYAYDLAIDGVPTPNYPAYSIDVFLRAVNRDLAHVGVIGGMVAAGELSPRGISLGGLISQVVRTETYSAAYETISLQAGQRPVNHGGAVIENLSLKGQTPHPGILAAPGLVVLLRDGDFSGSKAVELMAAAARDSLFPGADTPVVTEARHSPTYISTQSDLTVLTNRVTGYPATELSGGINTSEKPDTFVAVVPTLDAAGKRWNGYEGKLVTTGILSPHRPSDHHVGIITVETQTRRDSDYPGITIKLDIRSKLESMVNGIVVDQLIHTAKNRGNKTTVVIAQNTMLNETVRRTGYQTYEFHPEPRATKRDRDYVGRILTNILRPKRAMGTHKWYLVEVIERGTRDQRVLNVQVLGEYERAELAKRLKQLRNNPQPADARRMFYVV